MDVEMFIYYDQLPSKEKLQLARQQNQGSEPILTFDDRNEGHFGEFYFIDGVEFQIGNLTIALDLVELHLPEIDTAKVKRCLCLTAASQSLERQQYIWKPITEENK
jgi:hypothetical protein